MEERFGVYFLGYCNGTVYGSGRDRRAGTHRFADDIRTYRQVDVAKGDPPVVSTVSALNRPRHGDTEVDR